MVAFVVAIASPIVLYDNYHTKIFWTSSSNAFI